MEKYIATLVLHALGDTIGYNNWKWENNYDINPYNLYESDFVYEILFEFINLGGINDINLKGWHISDDTILHITIAESLLETTNLQDFLNVLEKKFINSYDEALARHMGNTTKESIELLMKNRDWKTRPYNKKSGGNGSAMRTSCIGLLYYGDKNREKLIQYSINSSKLTHNSAIGFLGGLVSALFTSYAIEQINLYDWPFLLIKLLESPLFLKYLNKNDDEKSDYFKFINKWKYYIENRFDNKKPIKTKNFKNLKYRLKFNIEIMEFQKNKEEQPIFQLPGSSGCDAVIMAYDSLLDSENSWEKIVIYSMLHLGDSDTVGCIAASWYGALYGYKHIPSNNLKYLEKKDHLINLGKQLYTMSLKNDN
jgi:ADP-ribosylglycohydrolase